MTLDSILQFLGCSLIILLSDYDAQLCADYKSVMVGALVEMQFGFGSATNLHPPLSSIQIFIMRTICLATKLRRIFF